MSITHSRHPSRSPRLRCDKVNVQQKRGLHTKMLVYGSVRAYKKDVRLEALSSQHKQYITSHIKSTFFEITCVGSVSISGCAINYQTNTIMLRYFLDSLAVGLQASLVVGEFGFRGATSSSPSLVANLLAGYRGLRAWIS